MKRYKIRFGLFIFFIALLAGCEDPIPVKEMSLARKAITRAYTVKAEKYAPKEIKLAKSKLYESHDLIIKEKFDECKKSADVSYKKAVDAYNKSVPLLARDTIEIADKSINEADEAYAEKFAAAEFKSAKDTLQAANDSNKKKDYYKAYTTAIEADQKAKNARNIAIGKKYVLKSSIDEVKLVLRNSKNYKVEGTTLAKFDLAEKNVKIAEESYSNLKLKKGFAAIEVAKINADQAYLEAVEGASKENIAEADLMLEKAGKTAGAKIAVDEFAASKESYENAKSLHGESKYKEAIEFSRESLRLSIIVMNTKKPIKEVDVNIAKDTKKQITENDDFYFYKVKYREKLKDCLWRIAGRYYKNPRLWKKIYRVNKNLIKDPDLIKPGWILKVPKL